LGGLKAHTMNNAGFVTLRSAIPAIRPISILNILKRVATKIRRTWLRFVDGVNFVRAMTADLKKRRNDY